jgi:hypothetical protein
MSRCRFALFPCCHRMRMSLCRSARYWHRCTSRRRMPGGLTTRCPCRLPLCVRRCSAGRISRIKGILSRHPGSPPPSSSTGSRPASFFLARLRAAGLGLRPVTPPQAWPGAPARSLLAAGRAPGQPLGAGWGLRPVASTTPRVHSPRDCGKIAFETPIRHPGHLGTEAFELQADVAILAHG